MGSMTVSTGDWVPGINCSLDRGTATVMAGGAGTGAIDRQIMDRFNTGQRSIKLVMTIYTSCIFTNGVDVVKYMRIMAAGTFNRVLGGDECRNRIPGTFMAGGTGAGTIGRGVMYCLNAYQGAIKGWRMTGGTAGCLCY